MNTRQEAAQGLRDFFAGSDKFLFLNGSFQNEKHPMALAAALTLPPAGSRILFRSNSKSNTGMFLGDVGIKKVPDAGDYVSVQGRYLFADTINRTSWRKSPSPIDVAVIYPVDSLDRDDGVECIADLIRRQASRILMVTWTDNKDFSWVDSFNPVRITFDAEAERPDYHERMQEIEGDKIQKPANLPAYAQKADPARLIHIHCRGCNKGSWAELNKSNPGTAIVRQGTGGPYVAKCLRCGRDNTDNYNW